MSEISKLYGSEISESFRESMLRLFYAVAFIYLCFNVVNFWRIRDLQDHGVAGAIWIAIVDGVMLFLSLATIWWLRQGTRSIKYMHVGGGALLALTAANVVFASIIMDSPTELFFLALMTVCVGAVALYRSFVLIADGIGVAMALLGASQIGGFEDMVWVGSTIGTGSLVSLIIFETRLRQMQRLHQKQIALEAAVAQAKAELTERKEADAREESLKEQLRSDMKLKAIGSLAGGVAHDMNNVLTAIRGVAEAALSNAPDNDDLRTDLQHILAAADRGSSLTRNLLGFARKGKRRSEPFDTKTVATNVVSLLRRTAPKRVTLTIESPESSPVAQGDADQIGHALMNLCLNAIEATGDKSTEIRIVLSTRQVELDEIENLAPGLYASITVHDQGEGMEVSAEVFEPFVSSKGEGHTGLGLPMVYGTLAEHAGHVSLTSTPGQGTVVTLLVPSSNQKASVISPAPAGSLLCQRPILVIDDEKLVRRTCGRLLSTLGLQGVPADGGQEGLRILRERPNEFAAVLLDLSMPELSGTECLALIREFDSTTPVVICSGYPKNQNIDKLLQTGANAFLPKPFSKAQLRDVLSSVIALLLLISLSACSSPANTTETARPSAKPALNSKPIRSSGTSTVGRQPTLAPHQQEILESHNRLRARHCAPPLRWSQDLAAVAQEWADRLQAAGCAFEHSQQREFGENLSFFAPVNSRSPDDVASGWYSEVSAYDFSRAGFDFSTGHFTQVVWVGTQALGCGQSLCNGGEIWVCNYDPPGNMIGAFQQNVQPRSCQQR